MKKKIVTMLSFLFFGFLFLFNFQTIVNAESKYILYETEVIYEDNRTSKESEILTISGKLNGIKKISGYYELGISKEEVTELSSCYYTYNLSNDNFSIDTDNGGCDKKISGNFQSTLIPIHINFVIDENFDDFTDVFDYLNEINHDNIHNSIFNHYKEVIEPDNAKYLYYRLYAFDVSLSVTNHSSFGLKRPYTGAYQVLPSKINWKIIYDEYSNSNRYYEQGFNDGQTSIDVTANDEQIWNEAYREGSNDGYLLGFESGKNSIDIEAIKQDEYNRGLSNGYNLGFAEGESSVDITSDNDTVIDMYIKENHYHTDYEFNLNYEKGKTDGIKYVYETIETDKVIKEYVNNYITVNKYHTDVEYKENFNNGMSAGKEYVYVNIESDPIIKEYWETKLVNGTTINIVNKGNEVIEVVKKYDVNHNSDDDLVINIHQGQDTYRVETVEEVIPGGTTTKTEKIVDYNLIYKILIACGVALAGVLVLSIIIVFLSFLFKPTKKVGTKRKAANGYVWSR